MPEAKQNERLQNPYPESVFPPMDLKPVSDYLIAGDYSPDRIFGNWGRQVWDNATKTVLKEVGEMLEKHSYRMTKEDVRHWGIVLSDEAIEALKQGGMPNE